MPISKLEVWHNNSQHSFSNITVNYVPHQFFCVTFISSNQNLILWQCFCVIELIFIIGIHDTESKNIIRNYVTVYPLMTRHLTLFLGVL